VRGMGVTQYYVASTIDGYIADDNDRIDWLLQFGFETFQARYDDFMGGVGAIVMGSVTYEYILREVGEPWAYRSVPVWVLTSRELPTVPNADIRFHQGDATMAHSAALEAAEGKNVWVMGGGNVAAQLANAGQLDELLLTIVPIVLGAGKRLLPLAGPTAPLKLMHTTTFPNGAIELVYRFARPR
jgi:dihydrofolate reductase